MFGKIFGAKEPTQEGRVDTEAVKENINTQLENSKVRINKLEADAAKFI